MRVTIVLPVLIFEPSGGFKVQYEYACALAARGHDVTIVHPRFLSGEWNLWRYTKTFFKHRFLGNRIVTWFDVDEGVHIQIPPILTGRLLPRADVTVLTSWSTAEATREPPRRAGRFAQVVYDYEFWMSATEEAKAQMRTAYQRGDVTHIATSSVVARMLESMGVHPAALVTAGIDLGRFRCATLPAGRAPKVGFQVRRDSVKALSVMVEACETIHRRRPDIQFVSYGQDLDTPLPDFVDHRGFVLESALPDFYNECSVFVLPSDHEGWGLPAAEAMACGAALVTTANGGTDDFTSDGVNALVVPRRQPGAIADAIERMIDDRKLRLSLVGRALETAQAMGLANATSNLEVVLTRVAERHASIPTQKFECNTLQVGPGSDPPS
jgi:glycosyltransferase involved in cell wall biosynthesis